MHASTKDVMEKFEEVHYDIMAILRVGWSLVCVCVVLNHVSCIVHDQRTPGLGRFSHCAHLADTITQVKIISLGVLNCAQSIW